MTEPPALPLLPVADLVCFPGAAVELAITEPDHRRLVLDLASQEPETRWLGLVLERGRPGGGFFPAGTLARLESFHCLEDGTIEVRLVGAAPFLVEEPMAGLPYPAARVRLLPDSGADEPRLRHLCEEIEELALRASGALGDLAPSGRLAEVLAGSRAEMVNHLAQNLEVPPLRKLELLTYPLDERAHHVAGILRSRARLEELLGPYRHLAAAAEDN